MYAIKMHICKTNSHKTVKQIHTVLIVSALELQNFTQ